MRSRADGHAQRRSAELVLRALGIVAISAWILNAALPRTSPVVSVPGDELGDALPTWTRDGEVDAVHVRVDRTPDETASAWLAALRRAGVEVSWKGEGLIPVALETFATANPAGGTIVLASAGADAAVVSDALGSLDTLDLAGSGNLISVRLASLEGDVTVLSGTQPARATPAPHAEPKRLYVAGAAGWEAKFVIAALEEAGWEVDARLFVAPGHDVVQGTGTRAALDTSRHSAVILIDSMAAESVRGVESFVRAGGGVVLAGEASRARRVADLVSWRAGERESAPLGTLPGDSLWRGLSRVPLELPTTDERGAVAIEIRAGQPIVVARRYYAGRVLGVGYDETWRWRMAGGEQSVGDHRAWWSRLVSSAARRPASSDADAAGAAPVAELHRVLGPSDDVVPMDAGIPRGALSHALGLVALGALLLEWILRRARGAR